MNSTQLHLQRSQDLLEQLRREIQQDLGLVALEQSEDVAYQPPLPWDAFVEQLPVLESIPVGMDDEVRELRARLARLGNVNPDAVNMTKQPGDTNSCSHSRPTSRRRWPI